MGFLGSSCSVRPCFLKSADQIACSMHGSLSGHFAIQGCESRQARKGAAVATVVCAEAQARQVATNSFALTQKGRLCLTRY